MQQMRELQELLRRERRRVEGDDGNGLVEYLLLTALIALVCILAISFLGDATSSNFSLVGYSINGAGS